MSADPVPPDPAVYAAVETLRDGGQVLIRSIQPDDRAALLAAIARTSPQSRFRRFFSVRGQFTEREIASFVNVDFVKHVALVALPEGDDVIVGGARYVGDGAGTAEIAFAVIDDWQGRGLGAALMRHLGVLARAAGLRALTAEVLPENQPMLKVLQRSGFPVSLRREPDVVHVTLALT